MKNLIKTPSGAAASSYYKSIFLQKYQQIIKKK